MEGQGPALEAYLEEFRDCAAAPTRRLIAAYVRGQIGPLPRKSVRPMARAAGVAPRTLQELLSLHKWDADRMREVLHRRVLRGHGGPGLAAFVHASACPKRGEKTPGVERQALPGGARAENSCVIVHLGLVDGPFRCGLESELYLPRSWTDDRRRRRAAGVPDGLAYRTVGEIALDLVERASAGGLRFDWLLAAPEVGSEPAAVARAAERGARIVSAVPGTLRGSWGRAAATVGQLAEEASPAASVPGAPEWSVGAADFRAEGAAFRLLVARRRGTPESRFFLAAARAPLEAVLARALSIEPAGAAFAKDRDEIGFGHFEVRTFRSLRRHLALSTLSGLFLSEARARDSAVGGPHTAQYLLPRIPTAR